MDFDFPLIPLLPLPITLVPAATFVALENNQSQIQQVFASSVSIGMSKGSSTSSNSISSSYASSFTSASSLLSDQERLGAIVDALGQASAKAQELPTSITQTHRLAQNPTHRVYILRTGLDDGEDQWLDQLEIGSPLMKESIRKSRWDLNDSNSHVEGTVSAQEQESKTSTRTRSEEKGVHVAGMLKMGEKRLFIVDRFGMMHEQEVCCVLDFYVNDSCQRRGFGKLLFDYMLKVEGIEPTQIAYDRPSPKLFSFLSKHFQLNRHLPQPNLFAIFEGFKLLTCGETIQVDDNALPAAGRALLADSSTNQGGNIHGTKPIAINRALKSSLVFSSGVPLDSSSGSSGTKPVTVNRALKSSLVFSSEAPLDSAGNPVNNNTGTRPIAVNRALQSSLVFGSGVPLDSSGNPLSDTTTHSSEKQQPMKRVSPAFASSFSLSSGGPPSGTPRTGTPTSARLSNLFASSIVFADPVTTD